MLSVILSCLILASGEKADLLALLNVMFSYVFVTFPYGVLGQACYLVVSIPDLRFLQFVLGLLHLWLVRVSASLFIYGADATVNDT